MEGCAAPPLPACVAPLHTSARASLRNPSPPRPHDAPPAAPLAPSGPPPRCRLLSLAALPLSSAADGCGTPPAQGDTALHEAAYWGRDDCVDLLVEKKANVNAQNVSAGPRAKRRPPPACAQRVPLPPRPSQVNRSTPLMNAAAYGHPSTVQKLLAAGADPTLKNKVRGAAAARARERGGGGVAAGLGAWGGAWP